MRYEIGGRDRDREVSSLVDISRFIIPNTTYFDMEGMKDLITERGEASTHSFTTFLFNNANDFIKHDVSIDTANQRYVNDPATQFSHLNYRKCRITRSWQLRMNL